MADLVRSMKLAALEAYRSVDPVAVLYGAVEGVSPLRVRVDARMALEAAQLVKVGAEALAAGDRVALLREEGGQRFLVLGRAGSAGAWTTPEEYGALGDGAHDDGPALAAALTSGRPVCLTRDLWLFSPVRVADRCAFLEGNGFALHADMGDAPGDGDGEAVLGVLAEPTEAEDAPLRLVYDGEPARSADFAGLDPGLEPGLAEEVPIGYVSCLGREPLPRRYREMMRPETSVELRYPYARAVVRNLRLLLKRCRGRDGLALDRLCDSRIENVSVVSEDGEGRTGLRAEGCHDLSLERVRCENFSAEDSSYDPQGEPGGGCGMRLSGDSISLRDYAGWNDRTGLALASGPYWTTNLAAEGVRLGFGGEGHWRALRCGEAAVRPVISNVAIDPGDGPAAMEILCPEAVLSRVSAGGEGEIVSGGLNELLWLDGVAAPGCLLSLGRADPAGYAGSGLLARQITARGCHFLRVENGAAQGTVELEGCFIEQGVWDVQHLVMSGTTVYGRRPGEVCDFSPLRCMEEAQITGCRIYHNRDLSRDREAPLIEAPSDSVWMANTWLYRPLAVGSIRAGTAQAHWANVREADLWGMILDDVEFGLLGTGDLT